MQPLTPFGDLFDWRLGTDYLGEILDPMTSERFAKGELHPLTLKPIPQSHRIADVNPSNLEERQSDPGERIQHLLEQSSNPTLKIDTSHGKELGANVWSSICSVKHEPSSAIQRKAPEDDDIKLSNLWGFSSDPLNTKTSSSPPIADTVLPAQVPKFDFQPVAGVETLHRRHKRIPSSSDLCTLDTGHMTTEFHPWSASKKSKQSPLPISIKSEEFWTNEHKQTHESQDIHERLRMASRYWSPKSEQIVHFNYVHDPAQVDSVEIPEGSPISYPASPPASDRYRKAGIMKLKPYRVPPPSIPFTLPKREI